METRYHHVSLDSDKDLSGNVLEVRLTDTGVWRTAEHADPPATAGDLPAPEDGFTRYWWRVLIGPGQLLDPTGIPEPLTLYGRLADAPQTLYPMWILGQTEADEAPVLTNECWPVVIPPAATGEWNALDGAVRAYAEALAVMTLRSLTAYTVGGCPVTVYPCRTGCGRTTGTWRTYPVNGGGIAGGTVYPVLDSGTWLNCGCGGGCGSCPPPGAIRLPGFPAEVLRVEVLGEELPLPGWWLDRGCYLRRSDGQPWPPRPGDVAVTYYPNPRPDGLGALAAGALAVEWAKAQTGGKCRLPSTATNVARAGVTVALTPVGELFPAGLTGIQTVDLYVRRVNPHRLITRPLVWSPDLAGR